MKVSEMVQVNDITLTSTCEHHFVTIDGNVAVAYYPKDWVIGLSKINRIVAFFAMLLLMGITFPAISSLAMESERQYAGSASALLGFAPFFLGGVVSPLVGIGNIFYSTSFVILVCALLALSIYWVIRHKIPTSAE